MTDAPETKWLPSDPESFESGLSTTGSLLLTWLYPAMVLPSGDQIPRIRLGIEVPATQVEILLRCLQQSATIRETLSAEPPPNGAH